MLIWLNIREKEFNRRISLFRGLERFIVGKPLRYHDRWILTKNGKKLFFAVQIEKSEINSLQKMGEKAFLLFKIEEKNYF